jgi:hypothetical protein
VGTVSLVTLKRELTRSTPPGSGPVSSGTITAMASADAYQEKYGFSAGYARLLFVCVAFVLGGIFIPLPTALRVVELVVFGSGGLVLLFLGLQATRLAALRVDAAGITLGGSPAKYASTTTVVPWAELRTVRLTRQPEAPFLPVITAVPRGKRESVSKTVQGWRLDSDKLEVALKAFAPAVRLNDER